MATPPLFVAEYESAWNTTTTPKSVSVTVAAGDTLVVYAAGDGGSVFATPTGGGLTYTLRQSFSDAGSTRSSVSIWTAPAASGQTFTLSVSQTGPARSWGLNCLRFSGSPGIGASGIADNGTGSGAPSLTFTTTGANSVVVVCSADFLSGDGSARVWRTGAGALTERTYDDNADFTVYGGYHADTSAAGSKTVGLTAPSTQRYVIAAVEVLGTIVSAPTVVVASGAAHQAARLRRTTRPTPVVLRNQAVNDGVIRTPGITSTLVVGAAAVRAHIGAAGITSTLVVGAATVTLTVPAAVQRTRPKPPTPTYELVVVGRVPQTSGPAALVEVDPIEGWTGLAYTEELSSAPRLDVGVKLSTLTEPVLQRLRNPEELPSELHLYRNGRHVYAGPLTGAQRQGESVSLQSAGLLYYLGWYFVTSDLVFSNVDQHLIVKALVDHWQALDFGNFGIDTSGIVASGVTRDATYLRDEEHNVGQRVKEMGARDNGFDIAVDPASRMLQLWYPQQGVDRSSGPDSIVIDAASITNADIMISVAVGDIASEAFGTGTSNLDTVYSAQANTELRAKFGRAGVAATFHGVSQQTTADAHTLGLLNARSKALFVPGPDARVTIDADLSAYGVGDTIFYQLDDQLGVGGPFRIRKRVVKVSDTGQETLSIEFV